MPDRRIHILSTLLFIFGVLLLLPWMAEAQINTRILLDRSIDSYEMSDNMEILEDPLQALNIDDVSRGRNHLGFKHFRGISPNFGRTDSAYWLRTLLINPYPHEMRVILEQPLPFLDSIDVYTPDPNRPGEFHVSHAGDRRPFREREMDHHHFLFQLDLAPGQEMPVYIRISSRVTLMAPFTFWLHSSWQVHAETLAMANGVFFGTLLLLMVFTLLLTFFIKDRVYPFFALFVFSIALMSFTTMGLSYRYFWPESPWLAERMQVVSITFVMFAGVLFARVFLNTRKHLPRIDRCLFYFMGLLCLIMLLSLTVSDVQHIAFISFSLIQFYPPLLILSGILARRKGVPAARFYLLAWTTSLIGATLASLTMLGVIPYHFVLLHATSIGFIVDTVLLALAMTDRINAIRLERDQAQKKIHDTLVEARNNLESEVERRTSELVDAKREADNANLAKTQFLANMSHELRTPLTSIIGFAELIQKEVGDILPLNHKRNLQIIHRSGVHLGSLIDDVLDVSVIESGNLSVKMVPVSFRTILDDVLAITGSMIGSKDVRVVDTTIEDRSYVVVADKVRLRQIVTNLISNAIKYSSDNSEVRVSLARQEGNIRFSVADTGPGIAPKDLERIFKPFTRLEEMADKAEGIGIGLSITKKLVELMAGEIYVDSRVGRGTSFHLDLVETARAPEPAEEQPAPIEIPPFGDTDPQRPLVLYIEDDVSNRILLETLFRKRPELELICAEEGSQGLELAEERNPALVLTDLRLPDMTAQDIFNNLRSKASTREIPIIVFRGQAEDSDDAVAQDPGFTAMFTKPLNVNVLMNRIDSLLFQPTLQDNNPGSAL